MLSGYFSRGMAFTLCLSQVAVTGEVIVFFPPVHLQNFSSHPRPRIETGTLVGDVSTMVVYNVGLGLPFLALSPLAVVFSTTTSGLIQSDDTEGHAAGRLHLHL